MSDEAILRPAADCPADHRLDERPPVRSPALEGRNPLTDPVAVQWQARFVHYFARRMGRQGHRRVGAWKRVQLPGLAGHSRAGVGLDAGDHRRHSHRRPVAPGAFGHGWPAEWRPLDLALTRRTDRHAHLAPLPVLYARLRPGPHQHDPPGCCRPAALRVNADIGGKPCLCRGTWHARATVRQRPQSARMTFARTLFALVHDAHGLLWWCGFEQSHLAACALRLVRRRTRTGPFRNTGILPVSSCSTGILPVSSSLNSDKEKKRKKKQQHGQDAHATCRTWARCPCYTQAGAEPTVRFPPPAEQNARPAAAANHRRRVHPVERDRPLAGRAQQFHLAKVPLQKTSQAGSIRLHRGQNLYTVAGGDDHAPGNAGHGGQRARGLR